MVDWFTENFNYPTTPIFGQNYGEAALSGNNGWVGSTHFIIREPPIDPRYVYAQNTDSGGAIYSKMHNTGGVDLDDSINKIFFSGYLGLRNDGSTNFSHAQATLHDGINNDSDIVCGIAIQDLNAADMQLCKIQRIINVGGTWDSVGTRSIPSDTLIPFSIIYNRSTQEYESFIFDNIEYWTEAEKNTTNSQNRPRTLGIEHYQKSSQYCKSYHDNFIVRDANYTPPIIKYGNFPRWQKTKYGMRPCY